MATMQMGRFNPFKVGNVELLGQNGQGVRRLGEMGQVHLVLMHSTLLSLLQVDIHHRSHLHSKDTNKHTKLHTQQRA